MDLFKKIFEASVEGIIVVNSSGKIINANEACHRIFGYGFEDLIGDSLSILIPDGLKKVHHKHTSTFFQDPKARQMAMGAKLVGKRKDGSTVPIEVSLTHFIHQEERLAIGLIIDVTERVKMEKKLRQSEEKLIIYASQLEHEVAERTEELGKAVRRLEVANRELADEVKTRLEAEREANRALDKQKELNELKSRFVSMASHEFRTPLSTILSSASLIERYTLTEQDPKRRKHIKRIKSNVNDLVGTLNDFLSLDKLEAGKVNYAPSEVDFRELVIEILDELQSISKKQQKIKLKYDREEVHATVDRQIVKNILHNLVSNAIKYSSEDGLITVAVESIGDDIMISVKDSGIGIPESDQKHLFERFFRANNAINIQGTGLGLNLVRRYVEIVGGSINFKSKEGEGSTFIVFLPANPDLDEDNIVD